MNNQLVGRYRLINLLGEGGMAAVYKAYDTRLECDVAIKFIRYEGLPKEQQQLIVERFELEARRMAKFLHPNIVRVTDYGKEQDSPYLVMPFLPGGTLKEIIQAQQGKPMEFQEAIRLLMPIANALEYAHKLGTVHRDVKPANILLTSTGQPMLTDFGVAKLLGIDDDQTLGEKGVGIGTAQYMAPEQWKNQISFQTDVYALGVIFYEILTTRLPYEADTPIAVMAKQFSESFILPRVLNPSLPREMEDVIVKALAKDTAIRFTDMSLFIQTLDQFDNRFRSSKKEFSPRSRTNIRVLPSQLEETVDEFLPIKNRMFDGSNAIFSERQFPWVFGLITLLLIMGVCLLDITILAVISVIRTGVLKPFF